MKDAGNLACAAAHEGILVRMRLLEQLRGVPVRHGTSGTAEQLKIDYLEARQAQDRHRLRHHKQPPEALALHFFRRQNMVQHRQFMAINLWSGSLHCHAGRDPRSLKVR